MDNNFSKKSVGLIQLYETKDGDYILLLGNETWGGAVIAEVAHYFVVRNGHIFHDYSTRNPGDALTRDDILLDIDSFKYLENLKKICYFGCVNIRTLTVYNAALLKGLRIVVDVLSKGHITNEQMAALNDSYKKIIEIKSKDGSINE